MALPKYTAQLRLHLESERYKDIILLILLNVIPVLSVNVIVDDPKVWKEIVLPIWRFFRWVELIYSLVIIVHIFILTIQISTLTDSSVE